MRVSGVVLVILLFSCLSVLDATKTFKRPYKPTISKEDALAYIQKRNQETSSITNVHVTCHTHDDVGWLKTVDQYFYGANNSIQHAGVQFILDSVIDALVANPYRKFVYVEQAFFQRWWREQNSAMRTTVKNLVSTGQLEFINGGWCMHDEAAVHYIDMIDQTALGHKFLIDEFGVVPRVGWQIDPFGHSSTQAALLSAEVGFDALMFGRIDYQDHDIRQNSQSLEFIWQASPSFGANASGIWSAAFRSGNYGPPNGFCYDWFCGDDPIQEDRRLHDYNVDNRVQAFVQAIAEELQYVRGNNIMFEMGSDFNYENANEWFKNLDKLIAYTNQYANGSINVQYSTPSLYVQAKHAENIVWPDKQDDFFPYADGDHSYWTGYFTSRPALKRYVRQSSAQLNAIRQLNAFSNDDGSVVQDLAEAQGVAQHHDAVSGTSKQHVAFDYAQRIYNGANEAFQYAGQKLNALTGLQNLQVCLLTNVSLCSVSQTAPQFVLVVYNQLARTRKELVKIPIMFNASDVRDQGENPINAQITPTFTTSATDPNSAPYTLWFVASTPALGYSAYVVSVGQASPYTTFTAAQPVTNDVTLKNTFVSLTVSATTHLISQMSDLVTGQNVQLTQNFFYYQSYVQDNDQNSGAYIFRPAQQTATPASTGIPQVTAVLGDIVQEVRQVFNGWLQQIIRVNLIDQFVEVEYTCGSVPIDDNIGKEVITRYSTNLATQATWYTDSNGRETLQRKRDYRPTWPLKVYEPVADNYFPANAFAYINANNAQLTILNDRSQGVASMVDGSLEFMIHRRILNDDGRGVGEPLNETSYIAPYPNPVPSGPGLIISGSHYLVLSSTSTAASVYRPLQHRIFAPLQPFFAPVSSSTIAPPQFSFAGIELPVNIDLISVQPYNGNVLIRLAHQFAVGEDSTLSKDVQVDVSKLFKQWSVSTSSERSLTGNQKYDGMTRLSFASEHNPSAPAYDIRTTTLSGTVITVPAMSIKTLLLTVVPHSSSEQQTQIQASME